MPQPFTTWAVCPSAAVAVGVTCVVSGGGDFLVVSVGGFFVVSEGVFVESDAGKSLVGLTHAVSNTKHGTIHPRMRGLHLLTVRRPDWRGAALCAQRVSLQSFASPTFAGFAVNERPGGMAEPASSYRLMIWWL
jgi:hypothetical protein